MDSTSDVDSTPAGTLLSHSCYISCIWYSIIFFFTEVESGNDSETSQSDYLQKCLKDDSDSRQSGALRAVGYLKTRSNKTREIVAPNREPGYGSVSAPPTKRGPSDGPSVLMRKLSAKKDLDKHAAAAKAGGGMQPPVAATKAGVGFQPPSGTNVHFLPSPITRCCCGVCTQDASGSEHFCSVSGKRCFAMCFSTGAPEGFGSRWPCIGCILVQTPMQTPWITPFTHICYLVPHPVPLLAAWLTDIFLI